MGGLHLVRDAAETPQGVYPFSANHQFCFRNGALDWHPSGIVSSGNVLKPDRVDMKLLEQSGHLYVFRAPVRYRRRGIEQIQVNVSEESMVPLNAEGQIVDWEYDARPPQVPADPVTPTRFDVMKEIAADLSPLIFAAVLLAAVFHREIGATLKDAVDNIEWGQSDTP